MNPSLRPHPRSLALALAIFAAAARMCAAQLPDAPMPQDQLQALASTGSISGFITDRDGESIPSAHVSLVPALASSASLNTVTTEDGSFAFTAIPPGPFKLSVSAEGFATLQTAGELHSAEGLALPAIALAPASSTSISVTATQAEIAEAQVHMEEQQRVLGVFPNFYVSYIPNPEPMTPKQKYHMALRTLVDPVSLVLNGVTAATQQADNIYDWGQGAQGFGKRYAAAYGTFLTSTMLGDAVFPVLFKQDPRYFYKGSGSIPARTFYAIANTVVCKGDNHRWQPAYSAILGGLVATGLSNAYYPASDRTGPRLLFEGTAIGFGAAAIQNIIQEFIVRRLTPHVPPPTPIE